MDEDLESAKNFIIAWIMEYGLGPAKHPRDSDKDWYKAYADGYYRYDHKRRMLAVAEHRPVYDFFDGSLEKGYYPSFFALDFIKT